MVVTDLTRMDGHICVAGIDPDTGGRVRPVNGQLGHELLRRNSGPFDIRSVVDLGPCKRVGKRPEIEDVSFSPRRCVDWGDMPPREFFSLCKANAVADLGAIGSALKQSGRSLTTLEGRGLCSLVLVQANTIPPIFVNRFGKLRYQHAAGIELSVTDIRLYEADLKTPDLGAVAELNGRLSACKDVVLSFGLARAWQRRGDSQRRHYLQLNNIHLSSYPSWQLG